MDNLNENLSGVKSATLTLNPDEKAVPAFALA